MRLEELQDDVEKDLVKALPMLAKSPPGRFDTVVAVVGDEGEEVVLRAGFRAEKGFVEGCHFLEVGGCCLQADNR